MLTVIPMMLLLLFLVALVIGINYIASSKKNKIRRVVKEEQLYNKSWEKGKEAIIKRDQRNPLHRNQRTEKEKESEEDRDSGIV